MSLKETVVREVKVYLDNFLKGRIFYPICDAFTRNWAKICSVRWVLCKRKTDPSKFLSIQKFVQTLVNAVFIGAILSSVIQTGHFAQISLFFWIYSLKGYLQPVCIAVVLFTEIICRNTEITTVISVFDNRIISMILLRRVWEPVIFWGCEYTIRFSNTITFVATGIFRKFWSIQLFMRIQCINNRERKQRR